MKCHIPGPNVKSKRLLTHCFKIFGRTIHALARFGYELYLEALSDALLLRTLNATESAYSMVRFNKSFFSYYNYNYSSTDEDCDGLKCKISMKSALSAFKSPTHIDKQVENLEIKLEPESWKLVFQLKCKHGVVKTHFISILDCKETKKVYTKDTVPNRISIHQRVLSEALSNFHRSNELITLEASAQCLLLRNYIDATADFSKLIRTQISLKPTEFDAYAIGIDTVITFTLKELKALLTFAEALNLPIQLHFQTTGLPVVFVVQNNMTFEAHFILATSKPDGATQSTATQNTPFKERVKRKESPANNYSTRKKHHLEEENISKCLEEDSHLFNFIDLPDDVNIGRNDKNYTFDANEQNENAQPLKNNCDINFNDHNDSRNEIRMDYENIPPSPSAKNTIKLVFSRCFEKTFDLRCIPGVVLADNSDSE